MPHPYLAKVNGPLRNAIRAVCDDDFESPAAAEILTAIEARDDLVKAYASCTTEGGAMAEALRQLSPESVERIKDDLLRQMLPHECVLAKHGLI